MIAKSDLLFVAGDDVDATHPYGDIDRIDYEIGLYGERENDGILAGVDIVYLTECYEARLIAVSGSAASVHTFHIRLRKDDATFPVDVYNHIMGDASKAAMWLYGDIGIEDVAVHRCNPLHSIPVVLSSYTWRDRRLDVVPVGEFKSPLKSDYISYPYRGLYYFMKFFEYTTSGKEWSYFELGLTITRTDRTNGDWTPYPDSYFTGNSIVYEYYCYGLPHDQNTWSFEIAQCTSSGHALGVTLVDVVSSGLLPYVKRVLPVYKVQYYSYLRNESNMEERRVDEMSVVAGRYWHVPNQNGEVSLSPYSDIMRTNFAKAYGDENLRAPRGTPLSKSSEYWCVHWIQIEEITFVVELKDSICDR